jgi:hypothetical protein
VDLVSIQYHQRRCTLQPKSDEIPGCHNNWVTVFERNAKFLAIRGLQKFSYKSTIMIVRAACRVKQVFGCLKRECG